MNKIKKTIEAVFLDRDGTIGGDDTIHYPGAFKLYSYTPELIHKLKNSGIKVFSFTNQPGISEGKATIQAFVDELTGIGFDEVLICPHNHHQGCNCRKPGTSMLIEGAEKYSLDLENCVVIGDRWSDMVAASKVKCVKILVLTGAGQATLNEHYDKIKDINIEYIAKDLEEAVVWLYQNYNMGKRE